MPRRRFDGIRRIWARGRNRPLVVLGLSFTQWIVTTSVASRIQSVEYDGSRSLVEPAEYAYAIWAPIFVLSSAFGVWQVLPVNRDGYVALRVGGPMAVAFATMVGWSVSYALRLDWFAQCFLLACWAALATAFLRVVEANRIRPLSRSERWFGALPIAPFLGWVTAANAVSLHTQLVRNGMLPTDGPAAIAVGSGFLVVALATGLWLLRVGRSAPVQLWGGYGMTLVWALAAIVVRQRTSTPVIAAIAGAGVVAVATAAVAAHGRGGDPEPRRAAATPA